MTANLDNATPELFSALAQAQAKIENASKNASNPHFRSKYADLAEVLSTIREVFPENGLSLIQSPSFDGSVVSVTSILAHSGGGYLTSTLSCVPAKTDAQGVGAATTYLRRYGGAAIAGIAQEDDDGNAAAHNRKPLPPKAGGNVVQMFGKPLDGAWDNIDDADRVTIHGIAGDVKELLAQDAPLDACRAYLSAGSHENKMALWTLLDSKQRATLKKAQDELKKENNNGG